jgi:hypothetical protein
MINNIKSQLTAISANDFGLAEGLEKEGKKTANH